MCCVSHVGSYYIFFGGYRMNKRQIWGIGFETMILQKKTVSMYPTPCDLITSGNLEPIFFFFFWEKGPCILLIIEISLEYR